MIIILLQYLRFLEILLLFFICFSPVSYNTIATPSFALLNYSYICVVNNLSKKLIKKVNPGMY